MSSDEPITRAHLAEVVASLDSIVKAQQLAFVVLANNCIRAGLIDPELLVDDLRSGQDELRRMNEHRAGLRCMQLLIDGVLLSVEPEDSAAQA